MSLRSSFVRNKSLFAKPRAPKPPRKKWRIGYILANAFKRMCMVIGFMVLLSAALGMVMSGLFLKDSKTPSMPAEAMLFLPIKGGMVEHKDTISAVLGDNALAIRDVVSAIKHAATDKRVKGLVVTDEGGAMNLVHLQELRDAVLAFRESGKKTYFYSPSYESMGIYYLASVFEEIWLQPVGIVNVPGIKTEMPYMRNVLDKIGVEPQIFARKDYKNLFENVTDTEMSAASREALQSVIESLADTIRTDIALSRGLDTQELQNAIDKGLLLDHEAKAAGLVDIVDYGDVLNRAATEYVTGDPDSDKAVFTPLPSYMRVVAHERNSIPALDKNKDKVALVYIVGQISQHNREGAAGLSSAESVVGNIRAAARREDIKMIVIRVDSPGGSPVASESIRRAVVQAQEKGKTVIISMGQAAASGGYWISAPADYIFASPMTFTGSIGVTGGKFSLQEMWKKLGINWDGVGWGENAGIWSFNQPYTISETERMNALMDDIYNSFVTVVAEGRNMDVAAVDHVAGGRVWLGAQAAENGLVDAIGGLDDALDYAAQSLGRIDRNDLMITILPRPKTPIEKIIELLSLQAHMGKLYEFQVKLMRWVEPMASVFEQGASPVSVMAVLPDDRM